MPVKQILALYLNNVIMLFFCVFFTSFYHSADSCNGGMVYVKQILAQSIYICTKTIPRQILFKFGTAISFLGAQCIQSKNWPCVNICYFLSQYVTTWGICSEVLVSIIPIYIHYFIQCTLLTLIPNAVTFYHHYTCIYDQDNDPISHV